MNKAAGTSTVPTPKILPPEPERKESPKQRLDRELVELLQEMRVMLPGITVMFGFLMTVPFSNRFTALNPHQRSAFFAVFMTTAVSTALLVAPTAYHRLRWRQKDKERLLQVGNKLAIAGLAFFALSIIGIAFIVTEMVMTTRAASFVAAGMGVVVVGLWFGLPMTRRARDGEE